MRLPTLLSLTALLLAGTVHGLDPAVAYARAIEATWAGILSKQRMLTEYTRVWEKGWGHGDLGIANEKAYGTLRRSGRPPGAAATASASSLTK